MTDITIQIKCFFLNIFKKVFWSSICTINTGTSTYIKKAITVLSNCLIEHR